MCVWIDKPVRVTILIPRFADYNYPPVVLVFPVFQVCWNEFCFNQTFEFDGDYHCAAGHFPIDTSPLIRTLKPITSLNPFQANEMRTPTAKTNSVLVHQAWAEKTNLLLCLVSCVNKKSPSLFRKQHLWFSRVLYWHDCWPQHVTTTFNYY